MVFFVCDGCGASVKKNQVEKHSWTCKKSTCYSCLDCHTQFWGDQYKTHIKCISEDQKYGGKDYKPKASSNKNENKQNSWIEIIEEVITTSNTKPHLVHVLQEVLTQPNLPRKQAKFENFLNNTLRNKSPAIITEAWAIFSKAQEIQKTQAALKAQQKSPTKAAEMENAPAKTDPEASEIIDESKISKKEKKKRKTATTEDGSIVEHGEGNDLKEGVEHEEENGVSQDTNVDTQRKKKKSKKAKENGTSLAPQEMSNKTDEPKLETERIEQVDNGNKKLKKSKLKAEEVDANGSTVKQNEPAKLAQNDNINEENVSKKKKRKKTKSEDDVAETKPDNSAQDNEMQSETNPEATSTSKAKKKKKRDKSLVTSAITEDDAVSANSEDKNEDIPPEKKSREEETDKKVSKKKKKKKKSKTISV